MNLDDARLPHKHGDALTSRHARSLCARSAIRRWAKRVVRHAAELELRDELKDMAANALNLDMWDCCDEDCDLCYGVEAMADLDAYFVAQPERDQAWAGVLRARVLAALASWRPS